jgi:hypothetical protein
MFLHFIYICKKYVKVFLVVSIVLFKAFFSSCQAFFFFACLNKIRYDPVRYDTVRYDRVRYDTIRYDPVRYDPVRYDTIRYDPVRSSTVRYDPVRSSTVRYGTVRSSTIQYGTVRYGTQRSRYPKRVTAEDKRVRVS